MSEISILCPDCEYRTAWLEEVSAWTTFDLHRSNAHGMLCVDESCPHVVES